jgi:glycosyltransferase involved in cell wall biosynthesis
MFHPQPRNDNRFRVLFVGMQCIRKGIGYLFDALRPLVSAGHVELWLVGAAMSDGKPLLDRNADLFVHHGLQPRNRLAWFYSQASVLVLPSIEEGLALVQAQAMACGVPVIATHNTGAEDLFEDGVEGFIVPPRSAEVIRDRVQLLLDNPGRLQELRAAALKRVKSLGGWTRYGQVCREAYRQVLAGNTALSSATN